MLRFCLFIVLLGSFDLYGCGGGSSPGGQKNTPAPAASFSVKSLSFGNQSIGTTGQSQAITLTNTGSAALTITGIAVSTGFSQANNCGSSLAAASSCAINVSFAPSTAGTVNGTLSITDNAAGSPQTVALTGTATSPGISLSPTGLSFANQLVGTTSTSQPVTVTNNGTAALTISGITASTGFSQTNNCGSSLAATSSCTINVTFAPTINGAASGTVSITDNAAGSPQSVSLSGTGVSPGINLSPSSLNFGNQMVGTTSPSQPVTLSNNGTASLTISTIAVSADFSQTNNCGATLTSGSSCTINVSFAPTTAGIVSGTVSVTDNATGSPQTVSLSGTGTSPGVMLSPGSLSFGNQTVGTTSPSQPATLTNTGTASLTISGISASNNFSQTNNCGATLTSGSSCTINVSFAPTSAGVVSGTVSVTDNASGSPQTISLSGTGTSPGVTLSPGGLGFGNQVVGTTSASEPVTLTNNGTASLAISAIAASASFTQTNNCGSSLNSGSSCTINVSFAPTATGDVDGTLSVSDNAIGSPQAVSLSGTGVTQTVQLSVTTYHNDNGRTGQNTQETILTTANVNSTTFGKLFSQTLDGYAYAQPLYVSNVTIPTQGVHNVVYAATMNDSVYAFDADSNTGSNAQPLWQVNFTDPANGITTVPTSDVNCPDPITTQVGIMSTPVIDTASNTIYVVARTKENGSYFFRLHALDIATGAEKFGGPVVIQASAQGTGSGSIGGTITFSPLLENQRAALLLQNGLVYISFGSLCDYGRYHGWMLAYDASALTQSAVWLITPNGKEGAIWQAGNGPAGDSIGNTFVAVGNGDFDADSNGGDYGQSVVKLGPPDNGAFPVLDYFTTYDALTYNLTDRDIGSSGLTLLPDQNGPYPHLLVQGDKSGDLFVVNRDAMGGYNPSDDSQIVQYLPGVDAGMWSSPAWWNNNVYVGASGDFLKAFTFYPATGLLSTTPTSQTVAKIGYPGTTVSISSDGTANGIVWALNNGQYATSTGITILNAYDATNVSKRLYSSSTNSTRDNPGAPIKMTVPTVVNGKVYFATQTSLVVYGLLN